MTFQYRDSALTACRVGISWRPWQPLPRTLALMQHEKKKLIVGYSGLCAPGPVSVAGLPLITATQVHSSHSQ